MTVRAPFRAVVHEERYGFRPFVKLAGRVDGLDVVEVLLGVRDCPRSKFDAKPEEISQETVSLCSAINTR